MKKIIIVLLLIGIGSIESFMFECAQCDAECFCNSTVLTCSCNSTSDGVCRGVGDSFQCKCVEGQPCTGICTCDHTKYNCTCDDGEISVKELFTPKVVRMIGAILPLVVFIIGFIVLLFLGALLIPIWINTVNDSFLRRYTVRKGDYDNALIGLEYEEITDYKEQFNQDRVQHEHAMLLADLPVSDPLERKRYLKHKKV